MHLDGSIFSNWKEAMCCHETCMYPGPWFTLDGKSLHHFKFIVLTSNFSNFVLFISEYDERKLSILVVFTLVRTDATVFLEDYFLPSSFENSVKVVRFTSIVDSDICVLRIHLSSYS